MTTSPSGTDATWPFRDLEEDPRYRQCSREMVASIFYWIGYLGCVLGAAWLLGYGEPAAELGYVIGVPEWVFWSASVSLVFCAVVPIILVKTVFRDISITAEAGDGGSEDASAERT